MEPDWVHLDTDENGITMNSYFVQHPEMILGEMKMESTRFGFDSACKAYKDIPLADLLSKAVQNIQGEIPEYEKGLMKSRMSRTLLFLPIRMCAIFPLLWWMAKSTSGKMTA